MTYDCDNSNVIITWEILSECSLSHYQLNITYNDSATTMNTTMTSANFSVSAGKISVTVRGIDHWDKAGDISDSVCFYVEGKIDNNYNR